MAYRDTGSAGQLLANVKGIDAEIGALAFSPTGDRLASGSHDGLIYLWDLNLAGEFNMLSGDRSNVVRPFRHHPRLLRFHPHPTHALLLASASSD